ncbi:MAG TPA: lipid-binding SYLF domain-containing protein [Terracidiphilus sp.]|nr:lipid-binding SYLF domain-containing protein [Terracidiphilus sp.]
MRGILAVILVAGLSTVARAADNPAASEKLDHRLDSARNTIEQIMSVPDKAIPDKIARKAVCVGVVPSVVKGAFVVGAEYGQGVVTCRTSSGAWSAPVFIRLAGGSFGLQAGGQGTDLVLVAVNRRGMQALLKDKVKIGADASAAAGPVGRTAQAATDVSMRAELLTWSRSRGIFAGIDLNGASISQNKRDTDDIYGGGHSFEQILHGGVSPTRAERPFLEDVSRYFGTTVASR